MMYANPKNAKLLFNKKYKLAIDDWLDVPEGRSFPVDIPRTGADCSPSALAAYLGISTRESIKLIPNWSKGKGTSTRSIVEALKTAGKPHEVVDSYYGTKSISKISKEFPCGLIETEFIKRGGKDLYVGHISAYARNRKGEIMIYDNNVALIMDLGTPVLVQGFWINEKTWSKKVLNIVQDIFPSKPIKDYHITRIIVPSNNLN